VTPEQASPPRQPRLTRRRKAWIAAGLLAGGLGLGGLMLTTSLKSKARGTTGCPVPAAPDRTVTERLFQDAKNLMREGKWVEARDRLLEIQGRDPAMPSLLEYLARVEREIPHQQHLVAAQEAMKAGQLAQAKAELDAVGEDTAQHEQVRMLRRELRDVANARIQEARALRAKGEFEQARAIAHDVLAALPVHPGANDILGRPTGELLPPPGPARPIDRFIEGDLPEAVELAQACSASSRSCKSELKVLTEFSALYNKEPGKRSVQDLQRLLVLDAKFTGDPSPSPLAQRFLRESRNTAKDTYLMGYALKESDPREARRLFRTVIALTVPEDELHQKSKRWLEKLQR